MSRTGSRLASAVVRLPGRSRVSASPSPRRRRSPSRSPSPRRQRHNRSPVPSRDRRGDRSPVPSRDRRRDRSPSPYRDRRRGGRSPSPFRDRRRQWSPYHNDRGRDTDRARDEEPPARRGGGGEWSASDDDDEELKGLTYFEYRCAKRQKLRKSLKRCIWKITPSPPRRDGEADEYRYSDDEEEKAKKESPKKESSDKSDGEEKKDSSESESGESASLSDSSESSDYSRKKKKGRKSRHRSSKRSRRAHRRRHSSDTGSGSDDEDSEGSDDSEDSRGRRRSKRSRRHKKSKRRGRSSRRKKSKSLPSDGSSEEVEVTGSSPVSLDGKKSDKSSRKKRSEESDSEDSIPSDAVATADDKEVENIDEPEIDPEAIKFKEMLEAQKKAALENEMPVGPMPLPRADGSHISYGGALRPGEGDAIAQYVQQGKRIPRRGEVGLSADEIQKFEDLGYVMSGSRHQRMNAIRIRKENQVYSAEDKRALAMFNYEEKSKREHKVMADLQRLVSRTIGEETGPSHDPFAATDD
jgi:hypothetical protein